MRRIYRQVVCWLIGHRPITLPARDHKGADNLMNWWNEDGVPVFKVQLCGRCQVLYWILIPPDQAAEMIEVRRREIQLGRPPTW